MREQRGAERLLDRYSTPVSCTVLTATNHPPLSLVLSYASVDQLFNPSLASVQYGSFFKLCRMQAVSFDLETLTGLMFLLFDSLSAGVLGMVAAGEHAADSLDKLAAGFQFIKANIGNPAAYNEVNLADLDGFDVSEEGGGMVSFVRMLKSVGGEAERVGKIWKEKKMESLMRSAKANL